MDEYREDGVYSEKDFAEGLPSTHPYCFNSVMVAPKADHGEIRFRGEYYKTMKYTILETGGFLRLHTDRGRVYFLNQNETNHRTSDWKIHFSIHPDDIPVAWNIIAGVFIGHHADIGMKVSTSASGFYGPELQQQWSIAQRGREITVYIFTYERVYKDGQAPVDEDVKHEFYLGNEFDGVYDSVFYFDFIATCERLLRKKGVRSHGGVAAGDLPLPWCQYASIRNEAFVLQSPRRHRDDLVDDEDNRVADKDENNTEHLVYVYPPNESGWNAAGHFVPEKIKRCIDALRVLHDCNRLD